MLYNGVV